MRGTLAARLAAAQSDRSGAAPAAEAIALSAGECAALEALGYLEDRYLEDAP